MLFEYVRCLWREGQLPMVNGLLKSNNTYFSFCADTLCKRSLPPELDTRCISEVDFIPPFKIEGYTIFFGEGSWGDDGWVLVFSEKEDLCWLLSGDINPIENVTVNENVIYAVNNNHEQFYVVRKTGD